MTESEPINYCYVCGAHMEERITFGRLHAVCSQCQRVHFRDPKVAAAMLVEKEGKILLVRRIHQPKQGMWTLPAGFVDADEDPRDAAVRECLEETGLKVRITGLLDVIPGREHPHGASIVILYRGEIEGGKLTAQDDADAAGFFGSDELPPLAFKATHRAVKQWRASPIG